MKSSRIILLLAFIVLFSFATHATDTETSPALVSHIPRERVHSTGVASIGYSKRRHILEIEFANGAVYRYVEVPPSVYRDLMSADSKARYYDTNIKGNYRSFRVKPRIKEERVN